MIIVILADRPDTFTGSGFWWYKVLIMKEKIVNTVHVERARHRITQAQLASQVGCSRQSIHAIENGKFEAGLKIALKIVRYLNELKAEVGMSLIMIEDIFKLTKSN